MYEDVLFVGVNLKLLGRAKVHWSVNTVQHSGDNTHSSRKDYRAEEIYINQTVYVFGARESILCVVIGRRTYTSISKAL